MEYALHAPIAPKAASVLYLGDDTGAKLLDFLGVIHQRADRVGSEAGLAIVGSGAKEDGLDAHAREGGRILYLPRKQAGRAGHATVSPAKDFGGSLDVPSRPEARGLSASDLRWRSTHDAWLLAPAQGIEVGADGLLARETLGKGSILYCQVDPTLFDRTDKPLGELIADGSFARGMGSWGVGQSGDAKGSGALDGDVPADVRAATPDTRSARVTVTATSADAWRVQFTNHAGAFPVRPDRTCTVTFWAKAAKPCSVPVTFIMAHAPFHPTGLFERLNLTPQWQQFRFVVKPEKEDTVRLEFQLAAHATAFWFTGISLRTDRPDAASDIDAGYLRFTRWRRTRALSQLLANLGASFRQDARQLQLLRQPAHALFLSGTWDAQLTVSKPESPAREPKNPDPGISEKAARLVALDAPREGWRRLPVPAYMESYGQESRWVDGEMVFRKTVALPDYGAGKDLVWSVGRVDETEASFFNGEKIGESRHWLHPRSHVVPGKLVKAGDNVLAARTWDQEIHGGWCAHPEDIFLWLKTPPTDFYHPDYIPDRFPFREDQWPIADNPCRYFRW